ncbi:superfamily II DNA or RNA helicase [Klosneuvirus KNV1]|uniref:Superfamily II DNA or RNA helicase n=1 Tax=Klosneuvirus KNV1 TaxID=1977640 RepID=A0A1V0SLQ2_9VIRU|nr:superfamily II DNA or RNA helicase [Klosneuvirus KNV1]
MNLTEFIPILINSNNIDEVLGHFKTQSDKGYAYERCWDVIIKFGFCPLFPKSQYVNMVGNFNNVELEELRSLKTYITEHKVSSGNSGGASDITLYNKAENKYIFISSKYPKTNVDKSVDYYDLDKIKSILEGTKDFYENYDIYVTTLNKPDVIKAAKQANKSNQHITKYLTESHILDKNDLEKYYKEFKNSVKKHTIDEYDNIYMPPKDRLILRFHQELITEKTLSLIEEGNKQFLWGCKPRSGKTYMAGGLIVKFYETYGKKVNALIITPAPTETAPQFTKDLFDKFIDFKDMTIVHIKNSDDMKKFKYEPNKNYVVVASKQLLQNYVGEAMNKELKKIIFNLLIFDENHFSGTTDISKNIINTYSSKDTVKVFLTATYNKPLHEWNINERCQMYWDIEDEQICKKIITDESHIKQLNEKHGEMVTITINNFKDKNSLTIDEIFKPYLKMPDLELVTILMDQLRYQKIKDEIAKSKYGFCFESLFALNQSKNDFIKINEVKEILRYISGSNKIVDFPRGDKSIFSRINKTCTNKNSRVPFTQIWFLPPNNINNTSKCLKKYMMEDSILSKYDVMIINSKNTDLASDVKKDITKQEILARKNNKYGLILLAGNMLSLGITLNNCDVVFLMNNSLSSDKVMQQMYRCMTEGENKKIGFVVDFRISRVLNTCVNYSIYKNESNIEEKIRYLIEYHLINIDSDIFNTKDLNSDVLIKKIMEIWKEDPINSFKSLLRNLENEYIIFDNDTQKLLNKSFTSSTNGKQNAKIEVNEDEEKQELPTGKEIIEKTSEEDSINNNEDDIEKPEKEIHISFTKDVLPYVIPLTCILTVKDNNKDFVEMLKTISKNPELLEIFDEQSNIWWNRRGLINLIKNIVEKYFDKKSYTYNISIQFKMSLQSLIDKPKELLELINDCLKPKETEKKKFGEVFTPMTLVNEMLDKLPKEVWTNKKIKWLDPATGMGNFPIAVYLRLMESLKYEIENDIERKRHIIENMLYMVELNKKNVMICRQIFDINNEYKLNLHEGDSLNTDYKKIFGAEQFDIIMGNPPYQENTNGIRKGGYGGRALWEKFVSFNLEKLLKKEGYLVFVHPSNWRKPEHELWDVITSKYILYLEIHGEHDGKKTFQASTRYDWYVLQNTKNKGNTLIKDELGSSTTIDLRKLKFLPNYMIDEIADITVDDDEEGIEVIYSRTLYGTDKKNIKMKNEDDNYKYPCIHNMTQNGLGYVYSNVNDKGHFGIPKVILSFGRHQYPFNDYTGKYGMTQIVYGIPITNKKEGDEMVKAINSDEFKEIIKATKWNTFYTEWRMFKYFKKDFYKKFNNTKKQQNNKQSNDFNELINEVNKQDNEYKELNNKILKIESEFESLTGIKIKDLLKIHNDKSKDNTNKNEEVIIIKQKQKKKQEKDIFDQ